MLEFLKIDHNLIRHPRLMRTSSALEISPAVAIGHLVAVFSIMAEFHEDGNMEGISDVELEAWAFWDGADGTAGRFARAFREHWVDVDMHIHGWLKRYARVFSERARNAARSHRGIPAVPPRYTRGKSKSKSKNTTTTSASPGATRAGEESSTAPIPEEASTIIATPLKEAPVVVVNDVPPAAIETVAEVASPSNPARPPRVPRVPKHMPVPLDEVEPAVAQLYQAFLGATDRRAERYPLTPARVRSLARLVDWAGSVDLAERAIRAVGADDFHRGRGPRGDGKRWDTLEDKPFRTPEAFAKWVEAALPASAGSCIATAHEWTDAEWAALEEHNRLEGCRRLAEDCAKAEAEWAAAGLVAPWLRAGGAAESQGAPDARA